MFSIRRNSSSSSSPEGERSRLMRRIESTTPDPLSTSYGILKGNNPGTIRATLEATNESVWKVSLDDYNEKLLALIAQIG